MCVRVQMYVCVRRMYVCEWRMYVCESRNVCMCKENVSV